MESTRTTCEHLVVDTKGDLTMCEKESLRLLRRGKATIATCEWHLAHQTDKRWK